MAKKKFDLLEQSPSCQLPCFNGLTPGISNDWETQDFFASLGFDDPSIARDAQGRWLKPSIDNGFWGPNNTSFTVPYLISSYSWGRPVLAVDWGDGKVTSIVLGFLPARQWIGISRLLATVDETPEVFFQEFGGEGFDNLTFYITLVFRNHHMQVTYTGIEQGSRGGQHICMAPDLPADVYIVLGVYNTTSLFAPFCEFCSPAVSFDWSKRLGMSQAEIVSKMRSGDFCLPPVH